jgi:hypothetical protein
MHRRVGQAQDSSNCGDAVCVVGEREAHPPAETATWLAASISSCSQSLSAASCSSDCSSNSCRYAQADPRRKNRMASCALRFHSPCYCNETMIVRVDQLQESSCQNRGSKKDFPLVPSIRKMRGNGTSSMFREDDAIWEKGDHEGRQR